LLGVGPDEEPPPHRPFTPILIARGSLRLAQGRVDQARVDLESGVARVARFRRGVAGLDAVGLDARLQLAEIDHASGKLTEAGDRLRAALAGARHWGTAGAIGMVLRVSGRLSAGEEGIALLRQAIEHLAQSPLGLEHTHALIDLGAAIRRTGARSDAREPLREALDRAETGGASVLADQARQELAATGMRIRRVDQRDRLTPSELRIVELAAEGKTNPQIAQTLFVTTKTVETHLAHAYRKLEIASRRDLPRALAEYGQNSRPS
jgi:DNA-binding CsgD family transcriptional regulator